LCTPKPKQLQNRNWEGGDVAKKNEVVPGVIMVLGETGQEPSFGQLDPGEDEGKGWEEKGEDRVG